MTGVPEHWAEHQEPAACPVCLWPSLPGPACGYCGLDRRGPASPAGGRERAAWLAAEGRRYDLGAAVRASGWPGDRDVSLLARLAGLARGGSPRLGEIDQAVAECDASEAATAHVRTGLGFTLARLVAGETDVVALAELSPAGIAVETLVTDDAGVPARSAADSMAWRNVLPSLPADESLRRYLLAGGSGAAQSAADLAALAAAAEMAVGSALLRLLRAVTTAALRSAPGHDGGRGGAGGLPRDLATRADTVLVLRTSRWPLLAMAAARARAAARPTAEITDTGRGTLADLVTETARSAPLRYRYDLILAGVDQRTGAVTLNPQPLFKAGTVIGPYDTPAASAYVRAPARGASRLALPVVARRGADPAGWPAVGMASIDGAVGVPTRLQARLVAPGRVTMRAAPGQLTDDGGLPGWPGLLRTLPGRLPGSTALDVVLLVELGGSAEAVAARTSLAGELAGQLGQADVRIAIVGYRDHFGRHVRTVSPGRRSLVVGGGLGDPGQARAMLAGREQWEAVPVGNDHAAPLEDALDWVAQPAWGWRPRARHLLVVLGRRPPHPGAVDHDGEVRAAPCPYGLSWRDALDGLRREHAVECMTVREANAGSADDDAERAWLDLGAAGRYDAASVSAASLMNAFGLTAAEEEARLCLAVHATAAVNVSTGDNHER